MKYVSIDIETTGTDPEKDQVLQIAAVVETVGSDVPVDQLPFINLLIAHDRIKGSPVAIHMNADLIGRIAGRSAIPPYEEVVYERDVAEVLREFLLPHFKTGNSFELRVNVAGKNFGAFDLQFLKRLPLFTNLISVSSRILDPAVLYFRPGDTALPDTKTCMERAGIAGDVAHNALDDARLVVKLIRGKLPVG